MKNRKQITAVLILILLLAVAAGAWFFLRPAAQKGQKTITVVVTHSDGTVLEKPLTTGLDTLWDAMTEAKLIEGTDGPYGKWITTVDGETASEAEGAYWVFTKNEQWVETVCDATFIADGEHYEFSIIRS